MPTQSDSSSVTHWDAVEGASFPLGHSWVEEEQAHNFAIYSKHAHSVELLFFSASDFQTPVYSYVFAPLKNKSGPIWHCRIPESRLESARFYAYRIDGPGPGPGFSWHTFDPEKLLIDPYAKAIFFPPDFDRSAAMRPGSNWGQAPLAVLARVDHAFDWNHDRSQRHGADLIIYEMHVRGFTAHPSSEVSEQSRGTFAGVIEKIPYLRELGVTAVELMPVFQFDPQEGNYWGYMPMSFFAPHHAYSNDPAACRQHQDFREMVRQLHAAGIEVILDVVFNHTAEGDQHGPTYNFKGIDNSTYYVLSCDPAHPYENFSGTGNTLHTANRAVRQLIVDSLRYWVKEMHVDGFRFDLASVFTRTSDGTINLHDPPIFGQISTEPELANIRLIAEPWDAGGAYQLGSRFPGQLWMQWNGRYRDTLRHYVRGDANLVSELMTRLYGSADLFPDDLMHSCRPWQSVNYITSHDGYTLYDNVTYNHKHNEANGHNNTDGERDGSWNCGWEGDDNVPADVMELRKQQVKNFFCLLMLSNGTPMFRMGDEFLQTQGGNNNPYNQDNTTTWLDWRRLELHRDNFRFFQQMIAFRKVHPSISRAGFWRDDVSWYGTERNVDMSPGSRALAYCLHGASLGDCDLYVMINASTHSLRFGIHEGHRGQWQRVVDTAQSSPDDMIPGGIAVESEFYDVSSHSVVVLQRGH
ncbi:MAG: glycogen-debranching protein [Planctomycetaceae bacterium]|nr:glycogen-debranching protein [Planctomycetaceae bacterium]